MIFALASLQNGPQSSTSPGIHILGSSSLAMNPGWPCITNRVQKWQCITLKVVSSLGSLTLGEASHILWGHQSSPVERPIWRGTKAPDRSAAGNQSVWPEKSPQGHGLAPGKSGPHAGLAEGAKGSSPLHPGCRKSWRSSSQTDARLASRWLWNAAGASELC